MTSWVFRFNTPQVYFRVVIPASHFMSLSAAAGPLGRACLHNHTKPDGRTVGTRRSDSPSHRAAWHIGDRLSDVNVIARCECVLLWLFFHISVDHNIHGDKWRGYMMLLLIISWSTFFGYALILVITLNTFSWQLTTFWDSNLLHDWQIIMLIVCAFPSSFHFYRYSISITRIWSL